MRGAAEDGWRAQSGSDTRCRSGGSRIDRTARIGQIVRMNVRVALLVMLALVAGCSEDSENECASSCGTAAGLTATIDYDAGRLPDGQYRVVFAFGTFTSEFDCLPGRESCVPAPLARAEGTVTMTATRLQITTGDSAQGTTPVIITITNTTTKSTETVKKDVVWSAGTERCTQYCWRAAFSARI